MGWNPLYRYSSGFVFSNISFVLAGLSFVIWVVFYFVFGRVRGVDKAIHASTAQGLRARFRLGEFTRERLAPHIGCTRTLQRLSYYSVPATRQRRLTVDFLSISAKPPNWCVTLQSGTIIRYMEHPLHLGTGVARFLVLKTNFYSYFPLLNHFSPSNWIFYRYYQRIKQILGSYRRFRWSFYRYSVPCHQVA